jgi:hypothetical protein
MLKYLTTIDTIRHDEDVNQAEPKQDGGGKMKELTLKTINNPDSQSEPFEIRMPLDGESIYCTCPDGRSEPVAAGCEHLKAMNSDVDAAMR